MAGGDDTLLKMDAVGQKEAKKLLFQAWPTSDVELFQDKFKDKNIADLLNYMMRKADVYPSRLHKQVGGEETITKHTAQRLLKGNFKNPSRSGAHSSGFVLEIKKDYFIRAGEAIEARVPNFKDLWSDRPIEIKGFYDGFFHGYNSGSTIKVAKPEKAFRVALKRTGLTVAELAKIYNFHKADGESSITAEQIYRRLSKGVPKRLGYDAGVLFGQFIKRQIENPLELPVSEKSTEAKPIVAEPSIEPSASSQRLEKGEELGAVQEGGLSVTITVTHVPKSSAGRVSLSLKATLNGEPLSRAKAVILDSESKAKGFADKLSDAVAGIDIGQEREHDPNKWRLTESGRAIEKRG